MRVALLSSTLDVLNGYGNITCEYCSALHARGVEIELFLPSNEQSIVDALRLPFRIRCVLPTYIFRLYQDPLLRYFRTIDVSRFDLVHSLYSFPYALIAARSARRYGKPLLIGEQGTYGVVPLTYVPERWLLRWCYRQAQRMVVPSEYTRSKILEYAGEQYPIAVIHNGVNFERFQRPVDTTALRQKYAGKTVLLTVGGLKQRKGQDLVIRALAKLKLRWPQLRYVMVGDGHLRPALLSLAERLGVTDQMECAGPKRGDDLVAYFHACDIYVHTPKVVNLQFEGFGIVYLEASACGKPIVATDAGGVRDAVKDNETGIVVADGDVDGIARAIDGLCQNSALRARMGQAGREYARGHDWTCIVDRFEAVYRGLVDA